MYAGWRLLFLGLLLIVAFVWTNQAISGYSLVSYTPGTDLPIVFGCEWVLIAFYVLLLLPLTATAITREREQGTLDDLLLTPLLRRDILGGKLVCHLLPVAAFTAPVLFVIPLAVLGRIHWFAACSCLKLLMRLVCIGVIGLYSSTLCKSSSRAITLALLTVTILFLLPLTFFWPDIVLYPLILGAWCIERFANRSAWRASFWLLTVMKLGLIVIIAIGISVILLEIGPLLFTGSLPDWTLWAFGISGIISPALLSIVLFNLAVHRFEGLLKQ